MEDYCVLKLNFKVPMLLDLANHFISQQIVNFPEQLE